MLLRHRQNISLCITVLRTYPSERAWGDPGFLPFAVKAPESIEVN